MADGTTRWSGMDARSWARLVSLVAPGLAPLPPRHHARDGSLPGGMLLVAHDGTTVLRALHTLRGVVATDGPWNGRDTLAALAAQCDTRFAVALRRDAAERFMERVGGRCTTDDDAVDTTLLALGASACMLSTGVGLHPHRKHAALLPAMLALPQLQAIQGKKALIVRGIGGREILAESLQERGVSVDYAELYQRKRPEYDATMLQQLFQQEKPQAVVVSSAESLDNLRHFCATATL